MRTLLFAAWASLAIWYYGTNHKEPSPAVESVAYVDSAAMPEAEGAAYTPPSCDCVDCQCQDCSCATIRKSRTVEPTVKRHLIVDPLTGVEVSGPAIVQLSIAGCGPCIRWMNQEAPRYELKGWEVPDPVYGTAAPAYPSFRIYDGKRWHQHTGWLTGDDVRRILDQPVQSSGSNSTAGAAGAAVVVNPAAAASFHSNSSDWLVGGQPWTRQGLIDHLAAHSNHGHSRASLQAMSTDQLNVLHNADHEGQGLMRSFRSAPVMGGCPGGSCPPRSTSVGRGLFGLRR